MFQSVRWLVLSLAVSAATVASASNYQISPVHSEKCLSVYGGSGDDGAAIVQWSCRVVTDQSYSMVSLTSTTFQIVAQHSGKCLEVENSSTVNGAVLVQATCNSAHAGQSFSRTLLTNGAYEVKTNSGYCMDVLSGLGDNGAVVAQWVCNSGTNQQFRFVDMARYSAGCGLSATSGTTDNVPLTVGTRTREFTRFIPADYNTTEALPLVFGLHGYGDHASDFRQNVIIQNASNAEKTIAFYPQGILYPGYDLGWNEACGSYDMDFMTSMINYAKANYCIDTSRIFMMGFSWGADMTHAAACCLGGSFRAVAPMSGSEMANAPSTCTTARPAYQLQYGTADTGYSQASFEDVLAIFTDLNSCGTTSTLRADGCYYYDGCNKPTSVCITPGQGHNVNNANLERMWSFFSSFRQ